MGRLAKGYWRTSGSGLPSSVPAPTDYWRDLGLGGFADPTAASGRAANRRMRIRMSGGVGAGRGEPRPRRVGGRRGSGSARSSCPETELTR
jgi:hypothetical protein